MSFAYVPVRDQNHVVHGKKPNWFVGYIFINFCKGLKIKKPSGKN